MFKKLAGLATLIVAIVMGWCLRPEHWPWAARVPSGNPIVVSNNVFKAFGTNEVFASFDGQAKSAAAIEYKKDGCSRCGEVWTEEKRVNNPPTYADGHATWINGSPEKGGVTHSVLCEKCWRELGTAEKRLPYYRAYIDWWKQYEPKAAEEYWPAVKAAVIREARKSAATEESKTFFIEHLKTDGKGRVIESTGFKEVDPDWDVTAWDGKSPVPYVTNRDGAASAPANRLTVKIEGSNREEGIGIWFFTNGVKRKVEVPKELDPACYMYVTVSLTNVVAP